MEQRLYWHYAPWARLDQIVQDGYLRPSNTGAENETPLLWFSARQDWEPTASKLAGNATSLWRMTLQEQRDSIGCIRFGLRHNHPRLLPWAAACKLAGTSFTSRRKLEAVGKRIGGSPSDWFAMEGVIPLTELRFQVLLDRWHDARPVEMVEVWATRESSRPD